jgi:hypothetical protein
MTIIISILGVLLIIFGVLDGWKYHIVANKVKLAKSSKTHSRMFTNITLGKDVVMVAYLCFKPDAFLMIMTLLGFIFAIEYFWQIYRFYPFLKRGLNNFKRPNLIIYVINSLLPNSLRRRL